jgi:hypothetical protein
MGYGLLFLMGVYLLPLAFVSGVGAWADGRRPVVALGLAGAGLALALIASVLSPDGWYGPRDVPYLTTEFVALVWQAF